MTHQSQTNGASLEDCHTNFFALTDLCGIKWRKLVQAERPDASPDPLDDPVLRSYSKCLAVDILCVWQRVAAPKPDPDPSVYLELSLQQPSTVTHPPLSLTAAKELWIFWYGEEPDLTDLVAPELLKSSDGGGQGSWESGLSYECRSLLFKALHNLIERCLLSRDVIRLGKWFVQPASNDRVLGRSSMHLSYSFAFFVHGDSTVCASMDIREHPPIRPLSAADLAEAQATAQQTEAVQKGVVLAPYGLAATLTGQSFRNVDPQTQKTLDDWSAFYPLYSKDTNQLPPVVEVVSGGVKMRYPTKYVLVTDLDDTKSIINSSSSVSSNNCTSSSSSSVAPIKMQQNNGATPATSSSSSLATTNTTNSSSNKENTPLVLSNNQHSSSNSSQNISKMGSGAKATQLPVVGPETAASNDLGNQLSMHIPLKIGTMMPERVWQDCIMHGTASMKGQGASSETENGPAETSCWDFSDPTRKYQCQCVRPLCHNNTNSGNMSDSSIANEGPPSAYRTPRSDSIPIPSVGSPPSAAPSPILDSQTSVPPQDQFLHGMSPHPQGGIHTPLTPSLENADKNTPAPTPTDQHESKGIPESPYQPTIVNSVEPPQTLLSNSMPNATATVTPKLEPPSETKPVIGGVAGPSNAPSESVLTSIVSLLKRPSLSSRDYENILDDDYNPKQILYDYSLWDAWLNHPVKRFKASDDKVGLGISKGINLYANEKLPECPELPDQVLALPTKLMADVKQELPSGILEPEAIKSEIMDDDKSENLFTEQGLRPSYNDLEHILENSDDASNDEGLQVHTPPASNKSPSQFDDCKRTIGFSSGPNIGSIGSIELSKMFPTPPSIEHHPSCSPYGSGIPDSVMTEIVEKAEVYPNLGSPVPEPIDDWSYVYQSPTICKLVGSSKYAPLQNLPSQQQTFSPSLMYKPSWLQQQSSQVPVPALSSATPSQQQIASQQKIKKEPGRALTPKNVPPSPRRPPSLPGGPFGVSRPRMSPAMSPMFNHGAASPMFGNSVRTPLAPPPPYDQAVASPASSSSFLRSNDPTNTEASALLVNVLLQDTALNVHRDHNFNSCMICVCNADSKKSIGNIRGSDSGTYLPLPNSSFRHMGSLDGYVDDDPISCSCGFSAIVNRRLAHRAGLFYEDEMEITSMAEDPALAKKTPLLSLLAPRQTDKPSEAHAVMDLLRDQCSVVPNCASSVLRAALTWRQSITPQRASSLAFNVLEHSDAQEIISLALEQAQLLQEFRRPRSQPQVSHKWPFYRASGPRTNLDIIRIMKSMTPLLQDAFHKKSNTRLWDAPYTVQGPLTWRQFHKLAGRSLGQCQPQPIPSIVVGHEKDWLSISPYAIQHWDKLLLEPYSYPRDIAYVVLVPDNDYVVSRTRSYFKELSTTYEMCRLGRHAPIKGWDGLIRVGTKLSAARAVSEADEWVSSGAPGDAKFTENLRHYAQACQHHLAPYLAKVPGDRSLLDPPDHKTHVDRPMPSPMPPPSSLEGGQEKAPSTPKAADEEHEKHEKPAQPEPIRVEDENSPIPHVVVYIVEPFSCGSDSPDTARMACLNLLRCFLNLLNAVPESMRANISTQIISLESVLELGQARQRLRYSDHMRYLALSIFSQSRRSLVHTNTVKSLTGFGTAASVEAFLKGKEEKDRFPYKLYTPPYILSSQHEKRESAESFGQTSIEQQSSVLYCNYCLSEDQSWLLAVATDNRGELLETATINVDIPNRTRRRKASARRAGLQKLMDFIVGVISQSVHPWHLVIGRVGRIGHGELKGWSWLLSKPQLVKVSKHLKDLCKQCSLMSGGSVPSILSACLVTLEPDTQLRVMPDQFTPDERFSQISTQLLTPQDVTCTHILVFPVSAVAQSFATAFKEQQEPDLGEDEFFAGLDDPNDEDVDGIGGLGDIFGDCFGEDNPELPQSSPGGQDRQSPTDMQGNPNRMSVGPDGTSCGQGRGGSNNAQEQENVGPVLQQPLALGYLVSTAPTGRMPPWFWAACPHLENVCPVFLRTALHLHCSNIQTSVDEDSLNPQAAASGHPLDSQFTADVLRYILEGYNVLSWLALDSNTHDRLSCLPIHVQVLMQLYHMSAAMA